MPDLIWGGDPDCKHNWQDATYKRRSSDGLPGFSKERYDNKTYEELRRDKPISNAFCSLCGAWRGAYGLEPVPEMYIEHTVQILREIRRVLRKDGVVFWNIGDCYYGGAGGFYDNPNYQGISLGSIEYRRPRKDPKHQVLKPKDLCLIPFRVAIAAQEDGWWVRSVIIWSKSNPMPESVTDRPSESHEYILLLTKSKNYYWDADAVRENPDSYTFRRLDTPKTFGGDSLLSQQKANREGRVYEGYGHNIRSVWMFDEDIAQIAINEENRSGRKGDNPDLNNRNFLPIKRRGLKTNGLQELGNQEQHHGKDILSRGRKGGIIEVGGNWLNDICPSCGRTWRRHFGVQSGKTTFMPCSSGGRNIRSVLEFPTQPFPGSHFAVFPEKLPEICIKAGTPEVGCCSKCGAPYERRIEQRSKGTWHNHKDDEISGQSKAVMPNKNYIPPQTVGWQPTCKCNADKISSLVLDPFVGSGTTLWVAKKLNRRCIGYELSEEYCALAVERNRQLSLGI